MKIFNGSSWQDTKALKIYNGASFVNAKKSWIYDGSIWKIHYPNFPLTQGIESSISGSDVVGSTLIAIFGNWNSDPAYAPESYSYQWYRNGSLISGANNNTYITQQADVGLQITVTITAINQRGSTPSASSNYVLVKPSNLTGLSLSDITPTISAPGTVTVSGGTNTWSANWTNTGASSYEVRTNNGIVSYSGGTSATGYYASAGSATVYVKSINSNGVANVSWNPSVGASSYTVVWSGGNSATVYSTSTTISYPTSNSLSVTVTPVSSNGWGGQSQSSSITLSSKASAENSGSTSSIVDPIYPPTYINFTENGFTGSVLTYPTSSLYSYPFYIARPGQSLSITGVSGDGTSPVYTYQWQQNSGSGWVSTGSTGSTFTIPSGQGPGGIEYRCAITATVSSISASTTSYSNSTGAVVNASGTSKAPPGGSWSNNISPTGGTLYITEPSNSYGVGSSYENWNYGPTWGYDIYIYRSTTSTGTYTLHSNSVKVYGGGNGQSQTKTTAGWYYAIVYTYNTNSVNGGSTRIPSSGGFQLT